MNNSPDAKPNTRPPSPALEPELKVLLPATVLVSLTAATSTLVLFAWIAQEVLRGRTEKFDLFVRTWVHQYASPTMTHRMTIISMFGGEGLAVAFIAAMAVFLALRWRRAATWLAITAAGAMVLQVALKYAYQRPRPIPFFGSVPYGYSFPSGHALVSFCFYGVLAGLLADRTESLLLRILTWIIAACTVVAIGLSRIYLGVHYPSDVIAGYLAAAVWVSTMVALDHIRTSRRQRKLNHQAKS